ncbi:MAG TPA: HDOD domain-containing protein [Sulfuricella sp.]|nr:HDOD domain-containing protein [Sulfuricella sp.]
MKPKISTSDQQQIDGILASGICIPSQPVILQELDKLVNKPGNSLVAIGNLINKDVGLAAAVFKVVNSSFYMPSSRVESITKAITIVGLAQVVNIIKGVSLHKVLGGQEPAYDKFWERSGEIASLSAIIAGKQISVCNIAADQAYMAGLFHECGVPILMQRFPEYCGTFRLNQGINWPNFREEDRRFNTDHTVVGYLVARHWGLPDFICKAVRFHHERLYVGHAALALVSIVQMARHLYNFLHQLPDAEWPDMRQQIFEEIGLGEEGAQEFEEDVLDTFRQQ